MILKITAPTSRRSLKSKSSKRCECELREDDDCTCLDSSITSINFSLDDTRRTHNGEELRGCLKKKTKTKDHCRRRKSVDFDEVHVREFSPCVGDNPSVTNGAPLSIQWNPCWEGTFPVDAYERFLFGMDRPYKAGTFTAHQRYAILRISGGVAPEVIKAAERQALQDKLNRAITIQRFHMDKVEGALELLTKGALNATLNRRKKKEQRKLLDQWRECDQEYLAASRDIDL